MPTVQRGRLFVVAAPSGAGKTSLVKALLERKPELRLSVSHTTRKMRPTEQPGREYYFVTVPEFKEIASRGEFLEFAQVFDNFYGTSRLPVDAELDAGHNVILEIDWQGARQVRKSMPAASTIFILPPSRAALEQRLRNRATDTEEVIARRLRDAEGDMSHWNEFDYVVVNDEFDRATSDLVSIVSGEGDPLRAGRAQLQPLLAELLVPPRR